MNTLTVISNDQGNISDDNPTGARWRTVFTSGKQPTWPDFCAGTEGAVLTNEGTGVTFVLTNSSESFPGRAEIAVMIDIGPPGEPKYECMPISYEQLAQLTAFELCDWAMSSWEAFRRLDAEMAAAA